MERLFKALQLLLWTPIVLLVMPILIPIFLVATFWIFLDSKDLADFKRGMREFIEPDPFR